MSKPAQSTIDRSNRRRRRAESAELSDTLLNPRKKQKVNIHQQKVNNDNSIRSTLKKIGISSNLIGAVLHNQNLLKWAQQITHDRALYCNIGNCLKDMGINSKTNITATIVQQIRNDPKKNAAFLKYLNSELCPIGMDIDSDFIDNLNVMKSKQTKLEPKCNDVAYQKCLNSFYIEYFGFSAVSLGISWWQLYESRKTLKYAKSKLDDYTAELNRIKQQYVEPIIKYHDTIAQKGVIDNLIEYQMYEDKISCSLDLLNKLQKQCRDQQQMLRVQTQNNTMSAFTMSHSGWTSWGLASTFPQIAVPLKILSVFQAVTAVDHGVQAYNSNKMCNEFVKFEKDLNDVISDLKQIRDSLKQYESHYIGKVSLWDIQQVVQWTSSQGSNFHSIAKIFQTRNVNGEDLLEMDHDTLQSLGMNDVLSRKRLLRLISKLN